MPSNNQLSPPARLFGLDKPLHDFLGGGYVADILLWKKKLLSGAVLAGATVIWLLFEVMEYSFITLLCDILCILMIILFIWSKAAHLMKKSPPSINEIRISESMGRFLFENINRLLMEFYKISCGHSLMQYIMTLTLLWSLSNIGGYFSLATLLYLAFLCLETLLALYVRYQEEVDYHVDQSNRYMQRFLNNFKSKVLDRIPRAAANVKKYM